MNMTDKIMDLSLLWMQASQVFPHFGKLDQDWDGLYRVYLEKVMAAGTEREHFLLLAEFLNTLGDGHTEVYPSRALTDSVGYLPFRLLFVGDKVYVNYEEVLSVNGIPILCLLKQAFRYVYHVGNYVPESALQRILPFFLKPAGNVLVTRGGTYPFDLSRERLPAVRRETVTLKEYGDILYVRMDDFLRDGIAGTVKEALPGKRAVILDIRENIGGMTLYGARVAELFLSGEFHGCRKHTQTKRGIDVASASQMAQESQDALDNYIRTGLCKPEDVAWSHRVWNNREYYEYEDCFGGPDHKASFDGPCVLLTSRHTVSAAEDFAALFRSNRRAKLIGAPTCGTSGTPLMQPLSSGSARICSVGYRLLDGTEFIGIGIQPDILLEPTTEDLRQGKDPVLEYALNYFE